MSITAIVIITLLSLFLFLSSFFMIKFALILLKIEGALEESLDVLDARQESISRILEIPLFFDSPEVRQVHGDIKDCRDVILKIAGTLSNNVFSNESGDDNFEEEKKD